MPDDSQDSRVSVGDNSSLKQIRYGRKARYGEERERVGSTLGAARHEEFARMPGGHGAVVREPSEISPAMGRARESGKPARVDVPIDPVAHAAGTKNQTMYQVR